MPLCPTSRSSLQTRPSHINDIPKFYPAHPHPKMYLAHIRARRPPTHIRKKQIFTLIFTEIADANWNSQASQQNRSRQSINRFKADICVHNNYGLEFCIRRLKVSRQKAKIPFIKRVDRYSYASAPARYDLFCAVIPTLYSKKVSGEFSLNFHKAKWLASKVQIEPKMALFADFLKNGISDPVETIWPGFLNAPKN